MKTYLLNRVESIVSKEEIASFEQFLFLSQSFQKLSAAEASESVYIRERVSTSNKSDADYFECIKYKLQIF